MLEHKGREKELVSKIIDTFGRLKNFNNLRIDFIQINSIVQTLIQFIMKETKTTYWLLVVIGVLSIIASIYLYLKGKDFNTYFIGGAMGIVFAATGIAFLRKKKN